MPGWAPESALCTHRHTQSSAALVLAKISSQQQFLCIHLSTNLLQLTEPYYYYEHVTSLYVILVLESTLQYPPELNA